MYVRSRILVMSIALLLTTGIQLFGQSGVFNTQYEFIGESGWVKSHVSTKDKGAVLLCESNDSTQEFTTLIKTDSLGNELWHYRFGQNNSVEGAIRECADSSYLLAFTNGSAQSEHAYHVLKLDLNGNEVFSMQYSFPSRFSTGNYTPAILPRNNGGCYFLTIVEDSIGNKSRWNLMSIDVAGAVVWSNLYDTSGVHLNGSTMDTCSNGDIMIAGTGVEQPSGNLVLTLARIAPNGNFQWCKRYQNNYHDIVPVSILHLSNDNFYITSRTAIPFTTYPSVSVIQMSSGGAPYWSNRYYTSGISLQPQMSVTAERDQIAFVTYGMDSVNRYVTGFGKVNASGIIRESKLYKEFTGNSIDTTGNGNYSITGAAGLYYSIPRLMSVDSTGASCVDTSLNLLAAPLPLSVSTGSGTMSFPAIASTDSLSHPSVQLVASVACGPNSIDEVTQTISVSIFPNPANSVLHIASQENMMRFEIYDCTGRLIGQTTLNARNGSADLTGYAGGVYCIRIYFENHVESRRLVIE